MTRSAPAYAGASLVSGYWLACERVLLAALVK